MKNIFVIRHGETSFNKNGRYSGRTDEPLNTIGINQAKQLAEKASCLNIGIIYCSPLKRALKTAEFIKVKHACGIIIDNHFIERSIGIYEGLTKDEAKINILIYIHGILPEFLMKLHQTERPLMK